MRVVSASDWRDAIGFETPVLLADLVPGDDAHCATCGPDVAALPRTQLWAFKHRHPNHHHGYVRFYCSAHVPSAKAPAAVLTRPVGRGTPRPVSRPEARAERAPARKSHADDKVRAMCPDCFIEVSATGVCGNCGTKVF